MTRRTRLAVGGCLLTVAAAIALPATVMAGPDGSASVQFGNAQVGSPFAVGPPPIVIHDASPNAQFNLVPRTVVVAAGGTVTFTVGVAPADNSTVPHQVAVCNLGIGPDDVVIANPSALLINDPNCPVVGPSPPSRSAVVQRQFNTPGRYLVICNLRPHFTEFAMYGWVNVK
jgi:plastocyanin